MLTPASHVVVEARRWLGVPWRHRGRTSCGIDCIGLIVLALLLSGWHPRNPGAISRLDYDRQSSDEELIAVLEEEGTRLELGDKTHLAGVLLPGDVLVFRFPSHRWPQHVALVTQVEGQTVRMIHARSTGVVSTSRVVEHDLADGWLETLDTAYRLEGVTPGG